MTCPCRGCSLEFCDKNNDICLRCAKRVKYVAEMDGMHCSVPVEMSDMASLKREKVEHDDQFMRDNPDMPIAQIAEKLGRTYGAISVRRSNLGIKKANRHALIKERAEQRKKEQAAARERIAVAKGPRPEASGPREPLAAPVEITPVQLTPAADVVLINTKGFEDLYERLAERARKEFRTPELQALYFISKALEDRA